MIANYFFIDGSSLVSQIKTLQAKQPEFRDRKLDPMKFILAFTDSIDDLDLTEFKRAVFYFPDNDTDHITQIATPNPKTAGAVRDVSFKYCGEKLRHSQAFNRFLETVPKRWLDRCTKSEKGIDIEICCDALKLAFFGKMERLFLFSNDRDFIPLCRTLKDFGVNVSLIHLSEHTNVNSQLVKECDTYDILDAQRLDKVFVNDPEVTTVEPLPLAESPNTTQEVREI